MANAHNDYDCVCMQLKYQSVMGSWDKDLHTNYRPVDRIRVDPIYFSFWSIFSDQIFEESWKVKPFGML